MADSDPIVVSCPQCQSSYELTVADCGQPVECACGHQFVVPEPASPESVSVLCPSCSAVYEVESTVIGENVECQCGTVFEAVPTAPPGPSPAPEPQPVEPAPPAGGMIRTVCPACLSEYELEEASIGQEVECACGVQFVVTVAQSTTNQSAVAPQPPAAATADAMIRTVCPTCLAEYELEAASIGEEVECSCGVQFVVTVAQASAEADVLSQEQPATVESIPEAANNVVEEVPAVDAPAPANEEQSATVQATSTTVESSEAASRQRTRKSPEKTPQKKSSANAMIMGGCAVAAVSVLLVFLFSGGDGKSQPKKDSTRTVAQKKRKSESSERTVAALDTSPVQSPADVVPEKRGPSLADRLKQAGTAASGTGQTESATAEKAGDSTVQATQTQGGSNNPNQMTKRNDFVIGNAAPPGKQPEAKPAEKPPAKTSGNGATASVAAADNSTGSKSRPNSGASEPKQTTPPRPTKRIEFVSPRRQYRRFKDAASAGFKLFASMREKKSAAKSGEASDIEAWETEVADTGGLLKAALKLVDDESDPKMVIQARLIMAYCYLEARQLYEAGILAHAIARWTPPDLVIEPESNGGKKDAGQSKPAKPKEALSAGEAILAAENAAAAAAKREAGDANVDPDEPMKPALEATNLAIAAFVQAHDAAPEDDREAEFKQIIELATLFDSNFPDHEKADSVRLYAGQLHQVRDNPAGAADWYARVSKASPEFARSQLMAGQVLWSGYLAALQKDPEGQSPKTMQLKKRAQQFLTAGVNAGADKADLTRNVVVARLTLAQLHLGEDRHNEAVSVLTEGEPSVTSTIGEGNEGRPSVGIRSVEFAKLAYTNLIRAYLGANRLEEARTAMATLQGIAGTEDSAALAKLHLDLSAEMTVAYQKLADNEQEDIELLTTIAASLQQVVAHAEGLSFSSLYKAASTASTLADVVSVPEDAELIYGQAASLYQAILDANLADDGNKTAIRFRLAEALGKSHQFEQSLKLYHELLTEQPNIFDAQFAAAEVMQALGEKLKDPNQLVRAISGNPETPSVWGWAKLSLTYQRVFAKNESREDIYDRFLRTRLHIAECRFAYARLLTDSKKKQAELEKAMRELGAIARTASSYDAPAWVLLDELYRTIQRELGRNPEPLFTST